MSGANQADIPSLKKKPSRLASRSHLLPTSMMVRFWLEYLRQSSSHDDRCSNVSRRVMSYTSNAPAAPR